MTMDEDTRNPFDAVYRQPIGEQARALWRAAFGDEYPEELETLSFVTRSELALMIAELGVHAGDVVADLGCGRGGPGIALAAATGATLVGVDSSRCALARAREGAVRAGIEGRARFIAGDLGALPLGDASMSAVICIDAIQLAPDRAQTLADIARIVRPGGRLYFSTWDVLVPELEPYEPIADHRPLLAAAGFAVVRYDEPAGWRDRQASLYAHALARADELSDLVARAIVDEAHALGGRLGDLRRVLCIAERLPGRAETPAPERGRDAAAAKQGGSPSTCGNRAPGCAPYVTRSAIDDDARDFAMHSLARALQRI
jgi:SAM-dependent methyltransferase